MYAHNLRKGRLINRPILQHFVDHKPILQGLVFEFATLVERYGCCEGFGARKASGDFQ